MKEQTILVTGANGEIGHGLISHLAENEGARVVALDLHALDRELADMCHQTVASDILNRPFLDDLADDYAFDTIYHLAALLSTSAERKPEKAHRVNVEGTLNLLEIARQQAKQDGRVVKFMYPSSIAAYGLPGLDAKDQAGAVSEGEWAEPITMYGINKLYGENMGCYYADHYRQLDPDPSPGSLDFRAIRFPGLISAHTMPTGGTSDYLPEMLHHAAQGTAYTCFVRAETRIPFMAMPDAIKALLDLVNAPSESLTRRVYNVCAFNPSAAEFHKRLKMAFPDLRVTYDPHPQRQAIVDSWPRDVDDALARDEWGWEPDYDLDRALSEYLLPTITERYRTTAV